MRFGQVAYVERGKMKQAVEVAARIFPGLTFEVQPDTGSDTDTVWIRGMNVTKRIAASYFLQGFDLGFSYGRESRA